METTRIIHSVNKMLSLGPQEKAFNVKLVSLSTQLQQIINRRKENVFKSLTVHQIKSNGKVLAAKLIWKMQNSVLHKNIRHSMIELRRNRLLMLVNELSNENEQAKEMVTIRA